MWYARIKGEKVYARMKNAVKKATKNNHNINKVKFHGEKKNNGIKLSNHVKYSQSKKELKSDANNHVKNLNYLCCDIFLTATVVKF